MAEQVTRIDKPWGYELHWAKTERYVGKVIHIDAGHALSLQYHNQKDETIYLASGRMLFEIKADRITLLGGGRGGGMERVGAAVAHGGGDEVPMEPITDDDIPF